MRSLAERLRGARIADLELRPVAYVAPEAPLAAVIGELAASRRPAVLVRDGERLVGIFTQRDVLCRTAAEAPDPATPIGELATPAPRALAADGSLAQALDAMVEGGYRQVPLVDEAGRAVGLLSSRDVLAFVAGFVPEATLNLPPRLHQRLTTAHGA